MTGKALYGLIHEINKDQEKWKGRKVLFLHTGGLYDIYSRLEQLSPLFAKSQIHAWPSSSGSQ
jgi:hypothetical protein